MKDRAKMDAFYAEEAAAVAPPSAPPPDTLCAECGTPERSSRHHMTDGSRPNGQYLHAFVAPAETTTPTTTIDGVLHRLEDALDSIGGEDLQYGATNLAKQWRVILEDFAATINEPGGTFACPICGAGTPHGHSPREVEQYRAAEAASDYDPSVAQAELLARVVSHQPVPASSATPALVCIKCFQPLTAVGNASGSVCCQHEECEQFMQVQFGIEPVAASSATPTPEPTLADAKWLLNEMAERLASSQQGVERMRAALENLLRVLPVPRRELTQPIAEAIAHARAALTTEPR